MSSLVQLQSLTYILPPKAPDNLGTPGRFAWLKLSQLRIDITYQRDILDSGKSNIRRIIEQFDWKKFGILQIGERGDGIYTIIDGQHRSVAALMCGIDKVPCWIQTGDIATEAKAFSAINSHVTRISPLQSFHADVAAGDAPSVALVTLCGQAGVTICRRPKVDFKPGETMALALLRREAIRDEPVLLASLRLLRGIDPNSGLGADEIRGTVVALKSLEKPLKDPARIGAAIGASIPKEGVSGLRKLLADAKARRGTRGGYPWDNFKAVLLAKISTVERAGSVPLNRLMAGK